MEAFEAAAYSDSDLIEADLLAMAISCSDDDDEDADDGAEDEGRCPEPGAVKRTQLVPVEGEQTECKKPRR
jgi:hypothetical protein